MILNLSLVDLPLNQYLGSNIISTRGVWIQSREVVGVPLYMLGMKPKRALLLAGLFSRGFQRAILSLCQQGSLHRGQWKEPASPRPWALGISQIDWFRELTDWLIGWLNSVWLAGEVVRSVIPWDPLTGGHTPSNQKDPAKFLPPERRRHRASSPRGLTSGVVDRM